MSAREAPAPYASRVDEAGVVRWLDRYVAAWRTYDAGQIGDLFADDVVYRYHPWDERDEAVTGREAIVASWLEQPDEAGSWSAEYRPWAVDGDRAVAVGTTRYAAEADVPEALYHNVFLLRFDADGRCSEFTDVYMRRD